MQDIVEFERRITAALQRLGMGIDLIAPALSEAEAHGAAEALRSQAEAAEAASASAQAAEMQVIARRDEPILVKLRERLVESREREAQLQDLYDRSTSELTRQLDAQSLELARMHKTATNLREELRRVIEAQVAGLSDPTLINRAMLAELDALRATRLTEISELSEISSALAAHLPQGYAPEVHDA